LRELETLVTGEEVSFKRKKRVRKQVHPRSLPEGQTEMSVDVTYEDVTTSYCWSDNYNDMDFLIFVDEISSTMCETWMFPKKWFKNEGNGVVVEEPVIESEYHPVQTVMIYNLGHDRECHLLYRTITGQEPKPDEIIEFRKSATYSYFFSSLRKLNISI